MRSRIVPGDGDPRHGTANGYGNLSCRCADCTAAWAAYARDRRGGYPPTPDRVTKVRRAAERTAIRQLIDAHSGEYERLREAAFQADAEAFGWSISSLAEAS